MCVTAWLQSPSGEVPDELADEARKMTTLWASELSKMQATLRRIQLEGPTAEFDPKLQPLVDKV